MDDPNRRQVMNERELRAWLKDDNILGIDQAWNNFLYLTEQRNDEAIPERTGWFVLTVLGEQTFSDGPYEYQDALDRFNGQVVYLTAVFHHVGLASADSVEPTVQQPIDQPSGPPFRWNAKGWEHSWQAVTRRLAGPAAFTDSAEVQAIQQELDTAFFASDMDAFVEAMRRLYQWSEEFCQESGVPPWWKGKRPTEAT
jgi:hypothetical protein